MHFTNGFGKSGESFGQKDVVRQILGDAFTDGIQSRLDQPADTARTQADPAELRRQGIYGDNPAGMNLFVAVIADEFELGMDHLISHEITYGAGNGQLVPLLELLLKVFISLKPQKGQIPGAVADNDFKAGFPAAEEALAEDFTDDGLIIVFAQRGDGIDLGAVDIFAGK